MPAKLKLSEVPDYDLIDEKPLRAILDSAQRLLDKVCETEIVDGSWNFRESVWPALGAQGVGEDVDGVGVEPRLVLLPLSRIASEGGFSGSTIHLGYFSDIGSSKIFPSLPLVVKVAAREDGTSKLVEEKKLAEDVRPYLAYHKDFFAVPLYLDSDAEDYDVLWSPFALTELVEWRTETSRLSLSARDLRQLLNRLLKK